MRLIKKIQIVTQIPGDLTHYLLKFFFVPQFVVYIYVLHNKYNNYITFNSRLLFLPVKAARWPIALDGSPSYIHIVSPLSPSDTGPPRAAATAAAQSTTRLPVMQSPVHT